MPPQGTPQSQGFPKLINHQKPAPPPKQLPRPLLTGTESIDILGVVIGTGLLFVVNSAIDPGHQPSVSPGLLFP